MASVWIPAEIRSAALLKIVIPALQIVDNARTFAGTQSADQEKPVLPVKMIAENAVIYAMTAFVVPQKTAIHVPSTVEIVPLSVVTKCVTTMKHALPALLIVDNVLPVETWYAMIWKIAFSALLIAVLVKTIAVTVYVDLLRIARSARLTVEIVEISAETQSVAPKNPVSTAWLIVMNVPMSVVMESAVMMKTKTTAR